MGNKKNVVKKGSAQAKDFSARTKARREATNMTIYQDGMQMALDISSLVLNQDFGLGPERLKRFAEKFQGMFSEAMQRNREDKDDKDRWYSEQKFEEAMKRAWGPYYEPRNVRYAED